MKKEDLSYICTLVCNLSGIPVRLYEGETLLFQYSMVDLPKDPILLVLPEIMAIDKHVGYHMTRRFYCYGVVVSDQYRIVLGPSRQTSPQEQELREAAFELEITKDEIQDFLTGMRQIARLPLESIMQALCIINYMVNREKLTLNDLIGSGENMFGLEQARAEQHMTEEKPDPAMLHNTLAVEQTIMNIIRKGDVAALDAFVRNAPAVRAGDMSREQLRQAKNQAEQKRLPEKMFDRPHPGLLIQGPR